MPYHKNLTPAHSAKIPGGTKAERTHHVITHNPSQATPGETLYVRCPKLESGMVLVPDTFDLVFDLEIKGHAKNRVVQNVAKNIVSRMVLKFEGDILLDLNHYNVIECYRDLYMHQKDRMDMTLYGIQSENMRKLRSGAEDASVENGGENHLYVVYKKKYAIRMTHPIISDHGAAYPSALGSHIEWEVKLAPVDQLIVTEEAATCSYKLTNIQLEYETLADDSLTREISGYYNAGKSFLYEHVQHFRTIPFKESDTIINENINVPRRSMKGLVILFKKEPVAADKRDSEIYLNPSIQSVGITIEGIANKVYAQKMDPRHFWKEARRYFAQDKDCCQIDMSEMDFLSNKYCLFIDLRSFEHNMYHGNGLRVMNTKDGVQLEIRKHNTAEAGRDDRIFAYIYVLSDAQITVEGSRLKSILF